MSLLKIARSPLYLAMFASVCIQAQEVAMTQTIVVTASGYSQDESEAPASISVIDEKMLEEGGYRDITDVLTSIPGVTLTNGGYAQDLSIRGMPADYTAILVDGRKRSGREVQAIGSQSVEYLWLPPLESIERIEVIRGPVSTLYGSDALAGVINIITKKDKEEWHGSLRAETIVHEDSEEGDFTKGTAYLSGPLIQDLLSADVSYLYQEREEDNFTYGFRGTELTSYRAALHLTPNETDEISLEMDAQDRTRTSSADKTSTSNRNAGTTENESMAIALSHAGEYDWGDASSFIQKNKVKSIGRQAELETWSLNSRVTLPVSSHLVTVGASGDHENLTEIDPDFDLENYQWALYSEDEWLINDQFTLASGARIDNNEVYDANLSGRIYGLWKFAEGWTLKTGVSTGFRAPTIQEMTSEWYQEKGRIVYRLYGNNDIKPETSVNTEMGLHYKNSGSLQLGVTAFHNDFNDKIDVADCPVSICGETGQQYYTNIEDAVTYGVEVNTSVKVTDSLSLKGAYTYTYSEQLSGDNEGQPLTQIPLHFASLTANWKILESVESWITVTYRGEESDSTTAGSTDTIAPEITMVDFGGSWLITDNIKFLSGVYNLLDKETDFDEYGYIEEGRRLWLALDVSF